MKQCIINYAVVTTILCVIAFRVGISVAEERIKQTAPTYAQLETENAILKEMALSHMTTCKKLLADPVVARITNTQWREHRE
jgi:hypothetical protein